MQEASFVGVWVACFIVVYAHSHTKNQTTHLNSICHPKHKTKGQYADYVKNIIFKKDWYKSVLYKLSVRSKSVKCSIQAEYPQYGDQNTWLILSGFNYSIFKRNLEGKGHYFVLPFSSRKKRSTSNNTTHYGAASESLPYSFHSRSPTVLSTAVPSLSHSDVDPLDHMVLTCEEYTRRKYDIIAKHAPLPQCFHGGQCVVVHTIDKAFCNCKTGYIGHFCEELDVLQVLKDVDYIRHQRQKLDMEKLPENVNSSITALSEYLAQ